MGGGLSKFVGDGRLTPQNVPQAGVSGRSKTYKL